MLNANHPHDERLSALASRDPDAVADPELMAHVQSCDDCDEVVRDLGMLSVALADLPDVAPPRPLRLLPPVPDDAAPESLGPAAWVRRLFAPALAAGAALAMVGLVGTAAPGALPSSMTDLVGGGEDAGVAGDAEMAPGEERLHEESAEPQTMSGAGAEPQDGAAGDDHSRDDADSRGGEGQAETAGLPAERSPWPMVLFTGVALVIGALLLRWILVPRAG